MITKKIKKNICNTIVGKNIVIWSVVMLLLWAALLPLHETSQSILFVFVGMIYDQIQGSDHCPVGLDISLF